MKRDLNVVHHLFPGFLVFAISSAHLAALQGPGVLLSSPTSFWPERTVSDFEVLATLSFPCPAGTLSLIVSRPSSAGCKVLDVSLHVLLRCGDTSLWLYHVRTPVLVIAHNCLSNSGFLFASSCTNARHRRRCPAVAAPLSVRRTSSCGARAAATRRRRRVTTSRTATALSRLVVFELFLEWKTLS